MGPAFGQIQLTIQKRLKSGCGIPQMNRHDAILNLAAIAIVLPRNAGGIMTAFVNARLVDDPNRLRIGMLLRHDFLTQIA